MVIALDHTRIVVIEKMGDSEALGLELALGCSRGLDLLGEIVATSALESTLHERVRTANLEEHTTSFPQLGFPRYHCANPNTGKRHEYKHLDSDTDSLRSRGPDKASPSGRASLTRLSAAASHSVMPH